MVFKPNSYSTHLSPKLLKSSKRVSTKMLNASLHLNYAFDASPQSLWFVFFFSFSKKHFPDFVVRILLLELHAQPVDKNSEETNNLQAFFLKCHPCFMPCDGCVYIPCSNRCAHPALIIVQAFKFISHLLFIITCPYGSVPRIITRVLVMFL